MRSQAITPTPRDAELERRRSKEREARRNGSVTRNGRLASGMSKATEDDALLMCEFRGEVLGTLDCGCGGKPLAYGCSLPGNESALCTLHVETSRKVSATRRYVTPTKKKVEFVGKPLACSVCQHRKPFDLSNVTIAITHWKRPEALSRLQASIQKYLPDVQLEIEDTGGNLSKARNALADRIDTPYMWLMEEDFELIPSSVVMIRDVVAILDSTPDISGVGGACLEHNRRSVWHHDFDLDGRNLRIRPSTAKVEPGPTGVKYVTCDIILNWAIHRVETMRSVRWDEAIPIQGEHWEYFYRSHLAGHRYAYVGEWEVNHYKDRPNDEYNKARSQSRLEQSAAKHGIVYLGNANRDGHTGKSIGPHLDGRQHLAVRDSTRGFKDWPEPRIPIIQPSTNMPDVIILGVGHSGTSILAKGMEQLGWHCTGTVEDSEDIPFRNANRALIDGNDPGDTAKIIDELPVPWVLKDPRLVETLSYWIRIFRSRRRKPILLWLQRDYKAIKQSYQSRNASDSKVDARLAQAKEAFEVWPWHKVTLKHEDILRFVAQYQLI